MTASADAQAAAFSPSQKRVPDFFIVGHPKCGTTAIYEMLRQHPQIYLPELKEPWFFAPELRSTLPSRAFAKRPDTLEEYLSLFDEAMPDQRLGEATPSYLRSRTAAAKIADLQPDACIIAILREPSSFLRSFHLQCLENNNETERDLRKALALEGVRRAGGQIPTSCAVPQTLLYSDHVQYVDQLRRYHAAFGEEQVLVLIYEDFRRENETVVRRVLRFLEVDDSRPLEAINANATVSVRSEKANQLLRSLYSGRGTTSGVAKAAVKTLTPRRLRRDALRVTQRHLVHGKPPPVDDALMLELQCRFKDEVIALGDYLHRDLVTLWGYDSIG
jgi:Sulfotransferase family